MTLLLYLLDLRTVPQLLFVVSQFVVHPNTRRRKPFYRSSPSLISYFKKRLYKNRFDFMAVRAPQFLLCVFLLRVFGCRMFLRFIETQRSQSSRTVQSCLPLSHVQNSKFVFLRVFRHCLASIWCACKSRCIYRSPLIGFFASSVSDAFVFVCRCMLPD